MIRFYFGVTPEIDSDEWYQAKYQLKYALEFDDKRKASLIKFMMGAQ